MDSDKNWEIFRNSIFHSCASYWKSILLKFSLIIFFPTSANLCLFQVPFSSLQSISFSVLLKPILARILDVLIHYYLCFVPLEMKFSPLQQAWIHYWICIFWRMMWLNFQNCPSFHKSNCAQFWLSTNSATFCTNSFHSLSSQKYCLNLVWTSECDEVFWIVMMCSSMLNEFKNFNVGLGAINWPIKKHDLW